MMEQTDFLIGYKTSPHTDQFDTGQQAANAMLMLLRKEITVQMTMKKVPMLLETVNGLSIRGPYAELLDMAKEMEKQAGILAASVFFGYAWQDIEEVGPSVVIASDDLHVSSALKCANKIAEAFWKRRKAFMVRLVPVREAIEKALRIEGKPIVLADRGDSVSTGAPGDGTAVLKELLEMRVKNSVVDLIVDPESVDHAILAGTGNKVTLQLGGKINKMDNRPVKASGIVTKITEGRFVNKGPFATGVEFSMGRTVIFTIEGLDVIIAEQRTYTSDLEYFRSLGIEPLDKKILALKWGPIYATYPGLAKDIIIMNTPGWTSSNFSSFVYKKVPRPIFPLDPV
jgi:microcystin degradation protein MlrC